MSQSPVGRVAVDHRVHIAAGHAEEEVWLAERGEGLRVAPFRLRDDSDAKPLRLEQAADDRHAEARVVDIGVARDEDHVAAVPAETLHLGARHRQKGRDAEAMRPMLAVGKKGLGARGRRDVPHATAWAREKGARGPSGPTARGTF